MNINHGYTAHYLYIQAETETETETNIYIRLLLNGEDFLDLQHVQFS